jgi:N,N'-diacetyllegionaminate synthase
MVTIIAEAAQGFEGDPTLARMLVRSAAAGGADMVKFQLVFADELATRDYPYWGLFKQLEMSPAAWRGVADEAGARNLGLVFDVYGRESLALALDLGARTVKLHSTDFFNDPLVDAAASHADAVLFSIGGFALDEVTAFIARREGAAKKLTLMYGFQAEPTPTSANNLLRLARLREQFPSIGLGFMDHADGDADEAGWLGLLALPLGVTVLEKHITLERSLKLEDYVSALDAAGFARYVARVRKAEEALGRGEIVLTDDERSYRRRAVKVVVSARPIAAGVAITPADIVLQRAPLDGARAPLERADAVVGRAVRRPVAAGAPLYADDLA